MIFKLEPRPFPNWNLLLQLIHNPLTCLEALASMRTRHPQKKGWFSNCDKTNSVMNDNELKPKSLCGLLGNSFQLVLCHFTMRLVIDYPQFRGHPRLVELRPRNQQPSQRRRCRSSAL